MSFWSRLTRQPTGARQLGRQRVVNVGMLQGIVQVATSVAVERVAKAVVASILHRLVDVAADTGVDLVPHAGLRTQRRIPVQQVLRVHAEVDVVHVAGDFGDTARADSAFQHLDVPVEQRDHVGETALVWMNSNHGSGFLAGHSFRSQFEGLIQHALQISPKPATPRANIQVLEIVGAEELPGWEPIPVLRQLVPVPPRDVLLVGEVVPVAIRLRALTTANLRRIELVERIRRTVVGADQLAKNSTTCIHLDGAAFRLVDVGEHRIVGAAIAGGGLEGVG